MHLPKINYPNSYRTRKTLVIAKKIPYKTTKVLTDVISSNENKIKKALPAIMLFTSTYVQHPQTAQISKANIATNKAIGNILKTNIKKIRKKDISVTKSLNNIKPFNTFTKSSKSLTAKYNGSAEELDFLISKLLEKSKTGKKNNPLFGKGKVFIESAERHGENPSLLVAIAMQESGRGSSSAARNKNNIGGLVGKHGTIRFKSVDDCIESMAKIIERHTKNNIESIEQLGNSGKYCAKSAAPEWIKNVVFYINKL